MKGFLTIAQNGTHDYVRMAYALAMSLKLSQKKHGRLSIIANKGEEIPDRYKRAFDHIIYIDKTDSEWKVDNKWQYFWLTPYDETIVLDTDMLFFHDISEWWNYLGLYNNLEFTTEIYNFKKEIIVSDYYRKTFTNNHLPNLYTALFYFNKSQDVEEYFKLVKEMFFNWQEFYNKFLQDPPKHLSGDVIYALAAKTMYNRKWKNHLKFVHMRGRLQHPNIVNDWNKYLQSFFTKYQNNIGLKINNYNQVYPFHYIKKNFLNDEVIELYEETTNTLRLF